MMLRAMNTTHVGSFPLDPRPGVEKRILADLERIGLDYPPYPQTRSFIDIFLEPLVEEGLLEKRRGRYYAEPEELREAKPPRIRVPEAEDAARIARDMGFKGLRAPVTGAYTLAGQVLWGDPSGGVASSMVSRPEIVEGFFAEYVALNAGYMRRLGYSLVFVDEPMLGVLVGGRRILYGHTEESIRSTLNQVLRETRGALRGIHVCGRISGRLFRLLASVEELDILNFEFMDNPRNISSIDQEALEKGDKILSPGLASSKNPRVESMEEIRGLLAEVARAAGGRVDYASADCGFGALRGAAGDPEEAYMIGLRKLENIVKAVGDIPGWAGSPAQSR